MKKIFLILFFLMSASYVLAQDITYQKVKQLYENFEHDKVIEYSDELIQKGNLIDSLKIEIYLMRANVFYRNGDDQSIRISFENILKIKKNYKPDQSQVSPKLIAIFNEVKSEYYRNNPDPIQPKDSSQVKQEIKFPDTLIMKNAVIKNFVLPGLGQIQFGNLAKGWITISAFTLNLGAMIYTVIDTKNKENVYLNESNELLIQQRYNDYNESFKLRNIFIISCAAIWLYSQIDFLFFSSEPGSNNVISNFNFQDSSPVNPDLQLSLKIPF